MGPLAGIVEGTVFYEHAGFNTKTNEKIKMKRGGGTRSRIGLKIGMRANGGPLIIPQLYRLRTTTIHFNFIKST